MPVPQFVLFLVLMLVGLGSNAQFQSASTVNSEIVSHSEDQTIVKLEKVEFDIDLPDTLERSIRNFVNKTGKVRINPFLEWEIRVFGEFTNEKGEKIVIDGFYFEKLRTTMKSGFPPPKNGYGYTDDEYKKLGNYNKVNSDRLFKIRFAPPVQGVWKYKVFVQLPKEKMVSKEYEFEVSEDSAPGYLTVGENRRYFERNGHSFYPVGCNMPWPTTSKQFDPQLSNKMKVRSWNGELKTLSENYRTVYTIPRVYERYREMMNAMADSGLNSFRTIMYPASTEIEWESLGDYSQRMQMAQELDSILAVAEDRDLLLFWNLQIHYTFQFAKHAYGVNWAWDKVMNGDTLCYRKLIGSDNPLDFFKNSEAKKYYKQRLRYIISRWGYSTSIGTFELFSEISNVGTNQADHSGFYSSDDNWKIYRDWQVEMAGYIKSLYNGRQHLLTASFAGEKIERDNLYESEYFDLMSSNIYNFNEPRSSDFWIETVNRKFLNEDGASSNSYTMPFGDESRRNIKPMMYSETDPVTVEIECSESTTMEMYRSFWNSAFSGLSTSFSWMYWFKQGDGTTYRQISEFLDTIELDRDGWHPGAMELIGDEQPDGWVYNSKYALSMAGNVKPKGLFAKKRERYADMSYLRSGDCSEAIGVISNLTYNVYSADSCFDSYWDEKTDPDRTEKAGLWRRKPISEMKAVNTSTEKLIIKGLKRGKHFIEFYYPDDQQTIIYTQKCRGRKAKVKFPELMPDASHFIILFKLKTD